MPIYEYQCTDCNEHIERLQKINDNPLIECPACHHDTLKRKISAAGFRLKGAGWYETDFKKDKQRNLSDEGKKAKSDDKATKSDKKTAKKDTTSKTSTDKLPNSKKKDSI